MTNTCEICGKTFSESRFQIHINRKRPCKAVDTVEVKEMEEKVQEVVVEVKPFLKWVGGKTQILDTVLSRFPPEMDNYHEPFLGGGSVLLGLLGKQRQGHIVVRGSIYASDVNPHLIGLYQNIQTDVDAVIGHLQEFIAECPAYEGKAEKGVNRVPSGLEEAKECAETYYYWIRGRYNALTSEEKVTALGSAMFLFLNKMCFRGVYREGPRGFNVPFGNYKNPSVFEERHLRLVSEWIQPVVFHCRGFADSLADGEVGEGDFVYLDPPYAPEKKTSFVGYTADGFGEEDHISLFARCHHIKEKGVGVLMSNADVALVREAFPVDGWVTERVLCRRAIHSKSPDAQTNEVLIACR